MGPSAFVLAFDVGVYIPIVVALIAGGAVSAIGLYTARPHKESIIAAAADTAAAAADKAVDVVTRAIDRQEAELTTARERIAVLEAALTTAGQAHERCAVLEELLARCTARTEGLDDLVATLREEVARLDGDVDAINNAGKQGPPGEKGPPGDRGEPA